MSRPCCAAGSADGRLASSLPLSIGLRWLLRQQPGATLTGHPAAARRYVKGVISDLLMNKLDLSLLVISKARGRGGGAGGSRGGSGGHTSARSSVVVLCSPA